jgi:hypothetical protein
MGYAHFESQKLPKIAFAHSMAVGVNSSSMYEQI